MSLQRAPASWELAELMEEVRKEPRRTSSIWEKAGKAAVDAAAASAGGMIGRKLSGRTSRASPTKSAAGAAAGMIGTELGKAIGFPGLGRFARGLLGGLMR